MNSKTPQLVVMITKDDRTVDNAFEIFEKCKNTKAKTTTKLKLKPPMR